MSYRDFRRLARILEQENRDHTALNERIEELARRYKTQSWADVHDTLEDHR